MIVSNGVVQERKHCPGPELFLRDWDLCNPHYVDALTESLHRVQQRSPFALADFPFVVVEVAGNPRSSRRKSLVVGAN